MIRLPPSALKIGKLTLPGVYVVGDELGDETVLGRNVLNGRMINVHELRLLLNGPEALMTLLDAGSANETA